MRMGEVGLVHRHELSGTAWAYEGKILYPDDAHIFMLPGK